MTGKKGFGDIEDAYWDFSSSSSSIVLLFFEGSTDLIHPLILIKFGIGLR